MNTNKLFQLAIALMAFILMHEVSIGQAISNKHEKINFTSFTVNTQQKRIMIDWATDNKVPTNYFEIERSSDGINFKTIALVLGPDPRQTNCDCYEGFDKPGANAKKYFYRLKHVSTDGAIDLSEMKMLAIK